MSLNEQKFVAGRKKGSAAHVEGRAPWLCERMVSSESTRGFSLTLAATESPTAYLETSARILEKVGLQEPAGRDSVTTLFSIHGRH